MPEGKASYRAVSGLAAFALAASGALAGEAQTPSSPIDAENVWSEHWLDPHELAAAIALIPTESAPARMPLPAARSTAERTSTKWNRTESKDGTAKVTIDSRLGTVWETKVGVDFGMGSAEAAPRPDPLVNPQDASSGAAWAQVAVPSFGVPLAWDKASIDARVDPSKEQGKLSTTFSRSVPITSDVTVTLQNSYSITQTLANGAPASSVAAPSVNPALSTTGQSQIWGTERALKFKLLPTDTTFSASTSMSTADSQWHHQIGAEQKIYGPLNLATSVTDPGTAASNKKITAGFSKSW
jgi:hypothetical protein